MEDDTEPPETRQRARRVPASAILVVFLRLGLTSFGGPIAHLLSAGGGWALEILGATT